MAQRKLNLIDALSIRLAITKDRTRRWKERRALQTRRTAMLLLGAALSVGGVSESLDETKFLVQKDLDGVLLVRQAESGTTVVADMKDGIAGNSIYKLARIVPDRFLSQSSDLMDHGLFADPILPKRFLATTLDIQLPPRKTDADDRMANFVVLSSQAREEFFKTLPFGELIHEKSAKYDVDPALVAAVIEQESRFKPRARSHRDARGLMQLMPRTGAWMGARNLYDPEQNIDAGVKYLKYLEGRFDGNQTKIIAAYNAGEGNVMRYGGIPPFKETRNYVKKVKSNYERRLAEIETFEQQALAGTIATR
ncbi:MAG TPA: lytic transglycosylase domain-containing protein [Thermoanaerobaculia bacterium]|nr:lytic transglycosylase domain-containing protein [Thermoanaerobaculia bacterium]